MEMKRRHLDGARGEARWNASARGWLGLTAVAGLAMAGTVRSEAAQMGPDSAVFRVELQRLLSVFPDAKASVAGLHEFYRQRKFQPLWVARTGATSRARQLAHAITRAADDGLVPADYDMAAIAKRLASGHPTRLAELELLLSRGLITYGIDLKAGRRAPGNVDPTLFQYARNVDPRALLRAASTASDLAYFLRDLAPANRPYRLLRNALTRYRRIAESGGWPRLSAGRTLHIGSRGRRVAILSRRLAATGDLSISRPDPAAFDDILAHAVEKFQRRHGFKSDGVVGPETRAALNVPVERRMRQIIINMERWRWMPRHLGQRYVFVNIAGFELQVIDGGFPVLEMSVVVGRPYRQTPVLSGAMRYVEFNPYWNIPEGIAADDILPHVRDNPEYLAKRKIRVLDGWQPSAAEIDPEQIDWSDHTVVRFPYRLRQDPGPENALGFIKFAFDNAHGIFLHDTPRRGLFERSERAYSSGCIRIERPAALAAYLLAAHPDWRPRDIETTINDGDRRVVALRERIPVYLAYETAWSPDGRMVQFRDDIYGRDRRLADALFGASASTRPQSD